MPIFDFLSGQFIDVIHWTDDTRDTMVWRFEREGHEIKYGAKLTVREGQAAGARRWAARMRMRGAVSAADCPGARRGS